VRKILKPDNILISRDDIDEFIKWDDVCLLLSPAVATDRSIITGKRYLV